MNLEGRKVVVNKSVCELKQILQKLENYKALMPDSLKTFEVKEGGFNFELNGLPKIGLKVQEVTDQGVVLASSSSSFDFTLRGIMNPVSDNQTEVQLLFEGKFNPFLKMMVEKLLQNFINSLTDKIESL